MSIISRNIVTLFLLILLMFLVIFNTESIKHKYTKHFLSTLIIVAVQCILAIGLTMNYSSANPSLNLFLALKGISFALSPLAAYNLVVLAIMNTSLEKYQNFLKVPLIINAGLSISSIWTGHLFTFTSSNEYLRGPLISLAILLNISYLLLFIVLELFSYRKYRLDDKVSFGFSVLLILTAMHWELAHYNQYISWQAFSLCLIFYYMIYLNQGLRRDPLTKLFNRRMYERDLAAFNGKQEVTIINIDVNGFKSINDSFGHHLGDEILQKTALIMRNYFDNFGYIYRVGGDEFCILLDKPLPKSIAQTFNDIEDDLLREKKKFKIPKLLSYGYYSYCPRNCQNIYIAAQYADNYMYSFKNKCKSKIISM